MNDTNSQQETGLRPFRASTLVVIPGYREERLITSVVGGLRSLGWPVLVVDDGSPDRTGPEARRAGAHVVRHPINLGQGAALRTGFAFALATRNVEYVVTFDADGQHDPNDVEQVVEPLARGEADVVLGSRFLVPETRNAIPRARRLLLQCATRVGKATTGLRLTDTHNGFRAFTMGAISRLVLTQDRMAHASEIQAEVARCRLRYTERPVSVRYTPYSMSKGQTFVEAVNIMWDLVLTTRRTRP